MKSKLVLVVIAVCISGLATQGVAGAMSLKISPLQYDVSLNDGEIKKGFVDITNPGNDAETVEVKVQAFRQTDNNGSLEFYDDSRVSEGVLLDYSEAEIGARETLHLAFSAESKELPAGNVFAAILASTKPKVQTALAQSVRVGALLFITNGKPVTNEATVNDITVPLFQFGNGLGAHFSLQHTTKDGTGFFPTVTVSVAPYSTDTVTGPLVFPGRSRQVDYVKTGSYFGIVKYTIATATSKQVAYSFVMTGYWRGVVPIVTAVIVIAALLSYRLIKHAEV